MEYLKVSGGKGSPKRELRASKNRQQQQKTMMSNVMEAIAQLNGGGASASEANENGVVRMKFMVRKQDLKKMLEAMHGHGDHHRRPVVNSQLLSASSAEQRLNLLRRNHIVRAANSGKENRRRSWRPELQSIPEEI